jgi:hypothetical protein
MTGFPNPAYTGDAIRKALGPDEVATASELAQQQRTAALDEAELRELERAEYYGQTPAVLEHATPAARPRRGILDRLLRR